ncbi:MAG: hypothetical protein CVU63_19855 [Deltaproteobacteria bacterium HGW-Deltaproteobacteria-20]|nr:MAG: hypothetical protein CVU63_19855 [Deltaproteobacteria bacterium HGW-Deltaproteobacteria-20]
MAGSQPDSAHPSYCVEESYQSYSGNREVYGPFPTHLVQKCFQAGGGDACYANRWGYNFFASLMSH